MQDRPRSGLRWRLSQWASSRRIYRHMPLRLRRWLMRPWIKPLSDSVFQSSPILRDLEER